MKIKIEQDKNSSMIKITTEENKCVFTGNYWDLPSSGTDLKKLFEDIGMKVELVNSKLD